MNHDLPSANNIGDWKRLQASPNGALPDWESVISQHRPKLIRMVELRMHPRLHGRLDASDIIQETFIEAARVLQQEKHNPEMPVFIWLRRLANQKLIQAHRTHLGAARRDAGREQARINAARATSQSIARFLIGNIATPSHQAIRQERIGILERALEQMDWLDREVLVLRHFEQLSGIESAEVLGISHSAVKKRYVRALEKLQNIMAQMGIVE